MSQSENWPNDDESDSQSSHTPSTHSEESQPSTPAPRSRLRPAGKAPALLPPAGRDPDTSDEESPAKPYNVEWKLSVNGREKASASVLGVETSLATFWRDVLEATLAKAVTQTNNACQKNRTKIELTTTHHGTKPISLNFDGLEIDWPSVDKHRRRWDELPTTRKRTNKITIFVTFHYTLDTTKTTRASATNEQLDNIQARLGDGAVMTRAKAVRQAYHLMRCPGLPCKNGDHCWLYERKHYPLHPHHMNMLVDHLQAGQPLNGHEDVPDTFRRLVLDDERDREAREEREREKKEREQRRKRRRRDSDSAISMHCHPQQCIPRDRPSTPELVFPTTPLMGFAQPREDLVRMYTVWQECQVSEKQKVHYDKMQELTLEHGFDLDLIASNQKRMCQFYMEHGVPEGFACRYVSDIKSYHNLRALERNEQ